MGMCKRNVRYLYKARYYCWKTRRIRRIWTAVNINYYIRLRKKLDDDLIIKVLGD